ncbi:hypothetical protein B0J11DRAFT_575708 [Dendryphion nanum]|uniref:Uncharacterized protein n=1 Tax=Dendryphion nanum TaxID=256645 RepID=A0A9P9ECW0_9PLEO|nr:hypothetical protein B0J11DRAFT_575708 [Dendryphion nanum]
MTESTVSQKTTANGQSNLPIQASQELSHTDNSPPSPRSDTDDDFQPPKNLTEITDHTYTTDDTVNISGIGESVPSARNGNHASRFLSLMFSPRKGLGAYTSIAQEKAASVNAAYIRKTLGDLADNTTGAIGNKLNRAMEGRDAVEMLNTVSDWVPRLYIPSPSLRSIEKTVDRLSDAFKDALERPANVSINLSGGKSLFAEKMQKNALKSLVSQSICKNWQLMSRQNLGWQSELHLSLLRLYETLQGNHSFSDVLDMTTRWQADISNNGWRLLLVVHSTGLVPIQIYSGFKLPAPTGWANLADFTRSSSTLLEEDDWEEIDG